MPGPENKLTFPRLCALLALDPTRLSLSMHNAGFKHLDLPFTYVTVNTTNTAGAFVAMRELGIRGYSLTIPHKEHAVSLVDGLSEEAKAIGAVNTVLNDGVSLSGYNTDWLGIINALAEAKVDLSGQQAVIFGAGGAARSAIFALKNKRIGKIFIWNRNPKRAHALAEEFGINHLQIHDWNFELQSSLSLFINATPQGSHLAGEESAIPLDVPKLTSQQVVFDMVTTPTQLLADARQAGAKTIAGSRMLLFQAVEQFKLFTGEEAPVEIMDQALTSALAAV